MRPKITLFFYLLFTSSFSFSQEIVKEGKEWAVLTTDYSEKIPQYYTDIYFFMGDTIIEGDSYKILLQSKNENKSNSHIQGYLREENGKVYGRRKSEEISQEGLLYDFSAKEGDTIHVNNYFIGGQWNIPLYVSSIEQKELFGEIRKVFYLKGDMGITYADIWYSGIGSLSVIVSVAKKLIIGTMEVSSLLCAYESGNLIYQDTNYNNCYLGIGDFPQEKYKQEITVSPNPVKDYVKISIYEAKSERYSVKLYDGMGKLVFQHELEPETTEISVKHLPKGIYFYCIYDKKGNYIESGKIVKIK